MTDRNFRETTHFEMTRIASPAVVVAATVVVLESGDVVAACPMT